MASKATFSSRLLITALGLIASTTSCSSPPVSPAMSTSTYQIPSVRSIATSPANGNDPIVGVWDTRVNNFQWQTAFIPGNAVNTVEYEFVGIITTPLVHFTPGEVMIVLNKAAGAGKYAGYQKWRNAFKYFWQPVTIDLAGNQIIQRNQPNPALPLLIDRTWSLTKLEGPPSNANPVAGRYIVGGRAFPTRAEAEAHQRRELAELLKGAEEFSSPLDLTCRVIVPSFTTFRALVTDPNADTVDLKDFIAIANQSAYAGVAEFLRATKLFRSVRVDLSNEGASEPVAPGEVVVWLDINSGQWFFRKPDDSGSVAIPIDIAEPDAVRKWNAWCRRVQDLAVAVNGPAVPPASSASAEAEPERKSMVVSGTGFVVDRTGIIVTNEHVVEGAKQIMVHLSDGTAVPARLVSANPDVDLAILAIDKELPISTTLRATDMVAPGEDIFVIGFPLPSIFSRVEGTITTGSVNALTGFANEIHVFRFQAPIQSGNSGGPIFDEHGCVAGVCFALMSPEVGQSIYYGIKSSTLREMLNANRVKWEACQSTEALKASEIWTRYRDAVVRIECLVTRETRN